MSSMWQAQPAMGVTIQPPNENRIAKKKKEEQQHAYNTNMLFDIVRNEDDITQNITSYRTSKYPNTKYIIRMRIITYIKPILGFSVRVLLCYIPNSLDSRSRKFVQQLAGAGFLHKISLTHTYMVRELLSASRENFSLCSTRQFI